ncbi:hypothetical protein SAMN04489716_4580 [Actinoplanes derwentensis]|uniref:Uncharacterized protein n=1 Tax=Actinoplanes derwentensis TaxID=113562 RepID=A0A1H2BFQ7_9ACTN|nr:hypothetical protein SAMN04489716_4580 [Actinoplanes derwentensis]
MSRFEPYRAGEMFPPSLLAQPGVDVMSTWWASR